MSNFYYYFLRCMCFTIELSAELYPWFLSSWFWFNSDQSEYWLRSALLVLLILLISSSLNANECTCDEFLSWTPFILFCWDRYKVFLFPWLLSLELHWLFRWLLWFAIKLIFPSCWFMYLDSMFWKLFIIVLPVGDLLFR